MNTTMRGSYAEKSDACRILVAIAGATNLMNTYLCRTNKNRKFVKIFNKVKTENAVYFQDMSIIPEKVRNVCI